MSGPEIFVIIIIALLLFGAEKLPDIAKTIGKGMRDFKRATDDIRNEIETSTSDFRKDLTDVSDSIKKDVSTYADKLKNDMTDVSDSIKSDMNDVASEAHQSMNEMNSSLRNDANEINENLKKASVDSQVISKEENKTPSTETNASENEKEELSSGFYKEVKD
jgi:sec-independent protein translocase protein TatA